SRSTATATTCATPRRPRASATGRRPPRLRRALPAAAAADASATRSPRAPRRPGSGSRRARAGRPPKDSLGPDGRLAGTGLSPSLHRRDGAARPLDGGLQMLPDEPEREHAQRETLRKGPCAGAVVLGHAAQRLLLDQRPVADRAQRAEQIG